MIYKSSKNSYYQRNDDKNVSKSQNKWYQKKYFRLFYWTFGLIGFIYQTTQLLTLYFSGKTIADNRIERLKYSQLPAITICRPWVLSIDRFSKQYPQYNETTTKFLKMLKDAKDHNDRGVNHSIFEDKFNEFRKFFFESKISLRKVFNDISIEDLNVHSMTISVVTKKGEITKLPGTKWYRSILADKLWPKICFTQLSRLDKSYSKDKNQIIEIIIEFGHKNQWYYTSFYGIHKVSMTLHSLNTFPVYTDENFQDINNGCNSFIQFREIQSRLLPPPYETKCKEYDIEREGQTMRSDCITQCMTDLVIKNCSLQCINDRGNVNLYREDHLLQYENLPLCYSDVSNNSFIECLELSQAKAVPKCEAKCPKNCKEIHYEFEISGVTSSTYYASCGDNNYVESSKTVLKIIHKNSLDQIIEHRPLMTSTNVLSNFGGLLVEPTVPCAIRNLVDQDELIFDGEDQYLEALEGQHIQPYVAFNPIEDD